MDKRMVNDFKKLRLSAQLIDLLNSEDSFDDFSKEKLMKFIFSEITSGFALQNSSLKARQAYLFTISSLIEKLTPKEFTQIFPIEKDFKSHKFEIRDYYDTKEFIEEIGWNDLIPNGFEFLVNYLNKSVFIFMLDMMGIVSDSEQRKTGKSLAQEFFEQNGVI